VPVNRSDTDTLKKIAMTSMGGKISGTVKEYFADLAVKAVLQVAEERNGKWYVDLDNIQIVKKHGGSLVDTQLVYGIIVDKEVVHAAMPKRVVNAKIALLDAPLEVEKPEIDAEIRINDPTQMRAFLEEEEKILNRWRAGARVEGGHSEGFWKRGVEAEYNDCQSHSRGYENHARPEGHGQDAH
jgi:chaperonin GroEL (HSP60 family)